MSFLGASLGGSAVAFAITRLVSVSSGMQTLLVLIVTLLSTSTWNLLTWKFALTSSSTYRLIGDLVGRGIVAAGVSSVNLGIDLLFSQSHELDGIVLILFFFVVSLLIGFFGSYFMH